MIVKIPSSSLWICTRLFAVQTSYNWRNGFTESLRHRGMIQWCIIVLTKLAVEPQWWPIVRIEFKQPIQSCAKVDGVQNHDLFKGVYLTWLVLRYDRIKPPEFLYTPVRRVNLIRKTIVLHSSVTNSPSQKHSNLIYSVKCKVKKDVQEILWCKMISNRLLF